MARLAVAAHLAARLLAQRNCAVATVVAELQDAELFENMFFSVSSAEAAAMDPQQRLLLEGGYETLHGAAHSSSMSM